MAVENGIVQFTGHVTSYTEKLAAEAAARRAKGVRGIAEEIEVRYPEAKKNADDEIAARALKIIGWRTRLPDDRIQVKVAKGLVTLRVHSWVERVAAERAAWSALGAEDVENHLTLG